jgi:hypothetical protein
LQRELKSLKKQVNKNEEKLDQTIDRVDNLETSVAEDRAQTILTLADHSERQDFQSNQSKMHCVLITGENKLFTLHFRVEYKEK